MRQPWVGSVLLMILGLASHGRAVILYSTATRNTDPPGTLTNRPPWIGPGGADDPRELLNSGWQWEGTFNTGAGQFLGTAIGPNHFITAAHVAFGDQFILNGQTYTTSHLMAQQVPGADLRIFRINETFPTFAPLWDASADGSEVGKKMVVIGRGTQRAGEIRLPGSNLLRGWMWGPEDHVQSWGTNVVTGTFDAGGFGQMIYFDFDADGGPNEGAMSFGDSAGAVFIKSSDGAWKLAGINSLVDGPWAYTDGGASFHGSLFDYGGMFVSDPDGPDPFLPESAASQASASYSVRISSYLQFITQTINTPTGGTVPEPNLLASVMMVALLAWRRRGSGG